MTADDQPIREAATIVLVRRDGPMPAVLMGMRGHAAVFMPSKYVFPGGAVDPGDGAALAAPVGAPDRARLSAELREGLAPDPDALAGAALRELAEETGLVIGTPGAGCDWPGFAEAGLRPDPAALTFVFRAITPPGRPRRFDARFFLADAARVTGDPDDFSAACDELSHLHWVPLSEALALDLPFITEVVLAEIAERVAAAGDGPITPPDTVPFFDNRGPSPRFCQIS